MSGPAVLFHVQHLLGIGHLRRAAVLARAMAAHGLEVTLVSGGLPVPDLDIGAARLVQLPPVRAADARFSALADEHGAPLDEAFKARRREALLNALERVRPEVLMTEMFPFGRRQLRFELIPLIEAARALRPRPLILASVRDILTEKRNPARYEEMAGYALDWYDRILIHGEPSLVPFEATFPLTDRIAKRLVYTGFVAEQRLAGRADDGSDGRGEVIVSAGGGAVGERLLRTAIAARPHSALAARNWRLLAGATLGDERLLDLQKAAGPGIFVEPARPDFPALLDACAVSVSQAGYNTVMDVLSARARAVLVPFAGEGETEQTVRAQHLAARGLVHMVEERALTPQSLAEAVSAAWREPPPAPNFTLDGAEVTARLVAELIGA